MTSDYDPFDIEWKCEDPLGREVILLKSIVEARRGKHTSTSEHMNLEDIRRTVTDPDEVHVSDSSDTREIYYCTDSDYTNQRRRVIVEHKNAPGIAISWSRYVHEVKNQGTVYKKLDDAL